MASGRKEVGANLVPQTPVPPIFTSYGSIPRDRLYANMTWLDTIQNWPFGDRTLFTAIMVAAYIVPGLFWDIIAIWTQFNPENPFHMRLKKYKIQPDAVIPWRLFKECVFWFLVKKLLLFPLLAYFVIYPIAVEWCKLPFHEPVPRGRTVFWQVLAAYAINDCWFCMFPSFWPLFLFLTIAVNYKWLDTVDYYHISTILPPYSDAGG